MNSTDKTSQYRDIEQHAVGVITFDEMAAIIRHLQEANIPSLFLINYFKCAFSTIF